MRRTGLTGPGVAGETPRRNPALKSGGGDLCFPLVSHMIGRKN